MSESSSDTESSCGWTIISNEGSDIETLGPECGADGGPEVSARTPALEQAASLCAEGSEGMEDSCLDATLTDSTMGEAETRPKAGEGVAVDEHVTLCSSSDQSDIMTLGDSREGELGPWEEPAERAEEEEEEDAGDEDLYLGTSSSSQYTFSTSETTVLPVEPPAQRDSSSSSSGDEAEREVSPTLRRRRVRRSTAGSEPEEQPQAARASQEEQEQEPEVPEQQDPRAAPQHHISSTLNKCILLALVIAISMGFGHFYGTAQIQERQRIVEKTRGSELSERAELRPCQKGQDGSKTPLFAPLSEYAPPPNPSAEHLVAVNPFDDSYNVPSFKPLTPGSPYLGHPHHPGFSGFGPNRMPPHVPGRMLSPYGGPYQMRTQPHPYAQSPLSMGFSRPPGFNYGHPENPNYGNQPVFNVSNMPFPANQPLRAGLGDHLHQMPPHIVNQSTAPDIGPGFGPEGSLNRNLPPKSSAVMSPRLSQQQSSFSQSATTHKQDGNEPLNKNAAQSESPRKQSQNAEEKTIQDNAADLKAKTRATTGSLEGGAEKLNGILHPNNESLKRSPQTTAPLGTPSTERNRKSSSSNCGGVASSKALAHPQRPSCSSAEPVYPCGICLSEVNDDQEAILCEASCQKWFHRLCTGMTETAYNLLTAEASAVWGCDTCMAGKGARLLKTREDPGTGIVDNEAQS